MLENKTPGQGDRIRQLWATIRQRFAQRRFLPNRDRRFYLAVGTAGLVAAGILAVATNAALSSEDPRPTGSPANLSQQVTADAKARAGAAARGDRSGRSPAKVPVTRAPKAKPSTGSARKAHKKPTHKKSTHKEPTRKTRTAESTRATRKATPRKTYAAWVNPMPGAATTSCYGPRWGVMHAGVDLAADSGTPIRAVGSGTVVAAGWAYTGYGISVMISHGNGYYTHYAHQSQTVVRPGEHVSAGQLIGYEGSTGDSTGPHLHFEVHNGLWNQIEPTNWLSARGVAIPGC